MRTLQPDTIEALKGWAKHHAALFIEDRQDGEVVDRGKYVYPRRMDAERVSIRRFSRDWIMLQFYNFTYKDEFEFIVSEFRGKLGTADLADFETRLSAFPARSDEAFAALLDEKRPAGYTPKAEA